MLVVQERNSSNVPTVTYTRGTDLSGTLDGAGGIGGLLARSDQYSGGNWGRALYYHADGNGNVTYLMMSDQTMAATYRYDPYGRPLSSSGTFASANTMRFSSKLVHPASGLYYYGYRFYDPNLQRWVNRDPIGMKGGLNLYTLVLNSPVVFFDIFGLRCKCTGEERDREKRALIDQYTNDVGQNQERGVPHRGKGESSCFNVNFPLLKNLKGLNSKCWTCVLEHRSKYQWIGLPFGLFGVRSNAYYDHWAVVCTSDDRNQRTTFDYWGNRPAGEDPNSWFWRKYPLLGGYDETTEDLNDFCRS